MHHHVTQYPHQPHSHSHAPSNHSHCPLHQHSAHSRTATPSRSNTPQMTSPRDSATQNNGVTQRVYYPPPPPYSTSQGVGPEANYRPVTSPSAGWYSPPCHVLSGRRSADDVSLRGYFAPTPTGVNPGKLFCVSVKNKEQKLA